MTQVDHIRDEFKLFSLAESFCYSGVLFALQRLGVFERMGMETVGVGALAESCQVRHDDLKRLLRAGIAIDLIEDAGDDRYCVAPAVRRLLVGGSDGRSVLGDFVGLMERFSKSFAELPEVVTARTSATPLGRSVDDPTAFAWAMHSYASVFAQDLAVHLEIGECQSLLDVGCGPGTYAFRLGRQNSDLRLTLVDGKEPLAVAREVKEQLQVQNEVRFIESDALEDEIPGEYDLILISNALHVLGEDSSRRLLAKLFPMVRPGGSMVIQAQYLDETRLGNRWPVFLDLIQLCVTESGRNHSVAETSEWLEEVGFVNIEHRPMSLFNTNSYVRGYRPHRASGVQADQPDGGPQ